LFDNFQNHLCSQKFVTFIVKILFNKTAFIFLIPAFLEFVFLQFEHLNIFVHLKNQKYLLIYISNNLETWSDFVNHVITK